MQRLTVLGMKSRIQLRIQGLPRGKFDLPRKLENPFIPVGGDIDPDWFPRENHLCPG